SEKDLNNLPIVPGATFIGKSGKFSKTKHTLSGGSVGLFEGKRIGRAKNLENLSKEIKDLDSQIKKLKAGIDENSIKIASLKASTKAQEIAVLSGEINLLQNELISVKTKQEQYQSFITNSQNRKQDIENKLQNIASELLKLEPLIAEINTQRQLLADKLI